jgi:hypothetical protein
VSYGRAERPGLDAAGPGGVRRSDGSESRHWYRQQAGCAGKAVEVGALAACDAIGVLGEVFGAVGPSGSAAAEEPVDSAAVEGIDQPGEVVRRLRSWGSQPAYLTTQNSLFSGSAITTTTPSA